MSSRRVFLTKRQLEVLRLRLQGHTQAAVASSLKTTRENVAVVERRARRNVQRAVYTLLTYLELSCKTKVELKKGESPTLAAKKVLREASSLGIKLKDHLPELAQLLLKVSGEENGKLKRDVVVYISARGSVSMISLGGDEEFTLFATFG
ncbi:MAG: Tfx family DNA-binding protein [Acidilobaceae archaeon]|nr:Tfx family DNA-binding protein [Acidilobaceae archaeon]MCX8165057.1 Tfx family DNA-binding protein [Acidilobaceae archaeon]MDW7974426.1 Tfx family DNA-binding protein [Sulfolobales archaeon]